jgi:hypothetical protein
VTHNSTSLAGRVNLTKYVNLGSGGANRRRFCPVVRTGNGRIRPDYVSVDGRPELHKEGSYYIEWSRQRHCAVCQCEALEPLELTACELVLPGVEEVLGDPTASSWLKHALRSALERDPVDAANDADVLARLLDERCRSMLSR